MGLLLICTSLYNLFDYKLVRDINENTRQIQTIQQRGGNYYNATVNLGNNGKIVSGYVHVMDSSSYETANKKFIITLDCKVEKKKRAIAGL